MSNPWPADKVERWPIAKLTPYARNARTHTDEQIAQLVASIKEWGWTNPVLVDEAGGIIAGHARVLASQRLSLTEVPVMVATNWTEAQKRAYVIADNKLASNAGWDMDLLRIEVADLQLSGFDTDLMGFSDLEIADLTADRNAGLTDPDEVPEPPAEPVSRLGDVWLLGKHRICCGDATSEADVALALGGVKPHLMVTDPPYGVNYDPSWRNSLDTVKRSLGTVGNDNRADWRDAWSQFPGDVAYVWHSGTKAHVVAESLLATDFEIRSQIIWAKPHYAISRGHYHPQHEPCWYAVRGSGHWTGSRQEGTVWRIDNGTFQGGVQKPENRKSGHSAQKPVECMKRPIENNSSPGQAVYDPFVGSGTTIIAAEMTGRSCHCLEVSSTYVDTSIVRWQNFSGGTATLEATGQSFAEVAAERKEMAPATESASA